MLNRYLGNKTELLAPILEEVGAVTPAGGRVGDLFAGTLSVALALKQAGYRVVANDVNAFSLAIGDAFLAPRRIPEIDLTVLLPLHRREALRRHAEAWADRLTGAAGFAFLHHAEHRAAYLPVLMVLGYLETAPHEAAPPSHRHTRFFDTYTEAGAHAAFRSSRGRTGKRRFFSPDNGRRIDVIANLLRTWRQARAVPHPTYQLLCCALFRAVEKVSNTQGTYHDFPRDTYDPRALKPLAFDAPPMDVVLAGGDHVVGTGDDSVAYATQAPPLDTLYLDPPYNFRQYTAYYFLPNLLCRYGDLDDVDAYFANVAYVRGQNMDDDVPSDFCSKRRFLDALGSLVDASRTRSIVLSYFNGRNHWNDFKSDPNGVGLQRLTDFFSGPRFVADSLRVRPIKRTNYQSYGGYKARRIDEYLFVAEKADVRDAVA